MVICCSVLFSENLTHLINGKGFTVQLLLYVSLLPTHSLSHTHTSVKDKQVAHAYASYDRWDDDTSSGTLDRPQPASTQVHINLAVSLQRKECHAFIQNHL